MGSLYGDCSPMTSINVFVENYLRPAFYIDYEKMGRDLELGGDIFTIETGYREVHIFWNH